MKLIPTLTILGSLCGGLLAATALAQTNTTAPWVSLFNGKDLTGWTIKGDPTAKISVKEGQITCNQTTKTTEHTFITTEAKYQDFILETEVKVEGPFNSGILIRSEDTPKAENTSDAAKAGGECLEGYQVKIDPTPRKWTGGIYTGFGAKGRWYYSLENDPRAQEAFKIGEWNSFRIEALGNVIKIWINDVPVTHMVNAKYSQGYIALKIHSLGNKPENPKLLGHFKNIRIITEKPAAYAQAMDLPARVVE